MPIPETVDLAPWLVVLIGGTLIPLVTGLLTKQAAHPGLKATVSIALSAALAAVAPVFATGSFQARETLALFVGTLRHRCSPTTACGSRSATAPRRRRPPRPRSGSANATERRHNRIRPATARCPA